MSPKKDKTSEAVKEKPVTSTAHALGKLGGRPRELTAEEQKKVDKIMAEKDDDEELGRERELNQIMAESDDEEEAADEQEQSTPQIKR